MSIFEVLEEYFAGLHPEIGACPDETLCEALPIGSQISCPEAASVSLYKVSQPNIWSINSSDTMGVALGHCGKCRVTYVPASGDEDLE